MPTPLLSEVVAGTDADRMSFSGGVGSLKFDSFFCIDSQSEANLPTPINKVQSINQSINQSIKFIISVAHCRLDFTINSSIQI